MNRALSRSLAAGVIILVLADWLTKFWVANRMGLGETLSLVDGWLYFVHRKNTGVAFSMLADLPDAWRVPLLSAASGIGVVIFAKIIATTHDSFARVAAAVVMGGAIGNLGDRLWNGHVTDFVLVAFFPFVFNLADTAITIGGVLLAIRLVFVETTAEPEAVVEIT